MKTFQNPNSVFIVSGVAVESEGQIRGFAKVQMRGPFERFDEGERELYGEEWERNDGGQPFRRYHNSKGQSAWLIRLADFPMMFVLSKFGDYTV